MKKAIAITLAAAGAILYFKRVRRLRYLLSFLGRRKAVYYISKEWNPCYDGFNQIAICGAE